MEDDEFINTYGERKQKENETNFPLLIALAALVFIILCWVQVQT
jgi:hypothetical protein